MTMNGPPQPQQPTNHPIPLVQSPNNGAAKADQAGIEANYRIHKAETAMREVAQKELEVLKIFAGGKAHNAAADEKLKMANDEKAHAVEAVTVAELTMMKANAVMDVGEHKMKEADEKSKVADERVKVADARIDMTYKKMRESDAKAKEADEKMKEADERMAEAKLVRAKGEHMMEQAKGMMALAEEQIGVQMEE